MWGQNKREMGSPGGYLLDERVSRGIGLISRFRSCGRVIGHNYFREANLHDCLFEVIKEFAS